MGTGFLFPVRKCSGISGDHHTTELYTLISVFYVNVNYITILKKERERSLRKGPRPFKFAGRGNLLVIEK